MRRALALAAVVLVALAAAGGASPRGSWLVTAYAPGCGDSGGGTASGTRPHYGTIAADPGIRFGTRMWVSGYGYGRVEDRGSAVYGAHVDVWLPSCATARRFTHYGPVIILR